MPAASCRWPEILSVHYRSGGGREGGSGHRDAGGDDRGGESGRSGGGGAAVLALAAPAAGAAAPPKVVVAEDDEAVELELGHASSSAALDPAEQPALRPGTRPPSRLDQLPWDAYVYPTSSSSSKTFYGAWGFDGRPARQDVVILPQTVWLSAASGVVGLTRPP